MPIQSKKILRKFLKWKYKHISERNFIYILSVLVGFLAGIGTLILKNLTHFIEELLQRNYIQSFHTYLYFIFPIIG
ncbi:MAG: chloride channel protein, partial [Flavobacteriaceae bacterium]|nr:chloride channel protein [Flavobacteriaceae bacterium]